MTNEKKAISEPYKELIERIGGRQLNKKIVDMILERERAGIEKYGCSVDEAVDQNWSQHALEEAIDLFVYMHMRGYLSYQNSTNDVFKRLHRCILELFLESDPDRIGVPVVEKTK